ncbi:NAD(P)-dependent oxidoreductase [Alkalihalobacillus sp. MEB130]|uniref:NAD-dependent epimerase/dehydratase family protein n=1 Tax=Alkalihalobacillus sp. MEB130 TaxID=2976704 RepID=UPI0028DE82CA|nr:NAD(P)-dependent oxidoreductase [Alkalihalobacillus sp. MEB130]MDT8859620.1 NAD(P)-dependent oxidoreductase [Alkalihalobacillus sp. MEB130]
MRKALVTGGLGFIGFHLVERLLSEGIEVVIIDQIPDEKKEELEEKWLRIGRNALVTLMDKRLEDVQLEKVVKDVDVIFHLAAATSSDSKWPKLAKVIENNVSLTKMLVGATPKNCKIIYASTVEVYGERPGQITERTPTNPTTAYGITKLASERLLAQECKKRGITYHILRLPTIYGPWQRSDMTYQQILLGKTDFEMDRSTLDVLYVNDCVEAFILAAGIKEKNEIFHLSSGKEGAWYEGLRLLGHDESGGSKQFKTTLSTEKITTILRFTPQVPLEKGLAKQREHVKQWQNQQRLN